MAQVISNPARDAHIAPCGLFCTNCRKLKLEKCKGCQVEAGFGKCPVRTCCVDRGTMTCAECIDFASPRDYHECGKVNSFIAKVFGFIFRSDRPAALTQLCDKGADAYLAQKRQTGRM